MQRASAHSVRAHGSLRDRKKWDALAILNLCQEFMIATYIETHRCKLADRGMLALMQSWGGFFRRGFRPQEAGWLRAGE